MAPEDAYGADCWLCGQNFSPDEQRSGAEVRSGDPGRPHYENVVVCLRCYHDFGVCPPGRRYTVRIETRLGGLPDPHTRTVLLHALRAKFFS